jgi:hypothetical protein
MSGAAANSTNDVSSEVSLFGAVVFAMTDTSAVLTDLVFVITESTVQRGELSKLVSLVIILTFGSGRSLKEN